MRCGPAVPLQATVSCVTQDEVHISNLYPCDISSDEGRLPEHQTTQVLTVPLTARMLVRRLHNCKSQLTAARGPTAARWGRYWVQVLHDLGRELARLGCTKWDLRLVQVAFRDVVRDSPYFATAWAEWAQDLQPVMFSYVRGHWAEAQLLISLGAVVERPQACLTLDVA